MDATTTITLPLPPDTAMILAALICIGVASYLVFALLPAKKDPKRANPMVHVADSLGFRLSGSVEAALLVLVLFVYFVIFCLAAIISLRALGGILFFPTAEVIAPTEPRAGLAFGTLLAAILGAPFIIWRSWIAAKQTAVAEESLFNDKINAAATDLAARRQVTRVIGDGDTETILTEWQDDSIRCSTAIKQLELLGTSAPHGSGRAEAIVTVLKNWIRLTQSVTKPVMGPAFMAASKVPKNISTDDQHTAVEMAIRSIQNDAAQQGGFKHQVQRLI